MKKNKRIIITVTMAIAVLSACTDANKPNQRKKIPFGNLSTETDQYGGITSDFANDGLHGSNVADVPAGYVLVSLPNAATDSSVLRLVDLYKPMAKPFLSEWAKNNAGLIINLSDHQRDVFTTNFGLDVAGAFSIPITVIWDAHNRYRVNLLRSLTAGTTDIKLNYISGESITASVTTY